MRRARTFVSVVAAGVVAHEASANPPPPKVLPDPPISAPTVDEAPTVVRKHDGVCYAFYPSGGTLAVECPKELENEPLGEAILKNAAGKCQYIPFASGLPGKKGPLEKCPALLSVVAKANVVPESSVKLIEAAMSARTIAAADPEEGEQTYLAPPPPARLEATPPQQVGCALSRSSADAAPLAMAGLALTAAHAVRRRRRPKK